MADKNIITVNIRTRQLQKLAIMMRQTGLSRSELVRRLVDSAYAQPSIITVTEDVVGEAMPERVREPA